MACWALTAIREGERGRWRVIGNLTVAPEVVVRLSWPRFCAVPQAEGRHPAHRSKDSEHVPKRLRQQVDCGIHYDSAKLP
jgi:hypothetical protein